MKYKIIFILILVIFLGYQAGMNEDGSERLYIENTYEDSSRALIYGEFDNDILLLNAEVSIKYDLNVAGTIYNKKSIKFSDFVFQPNYKLESIEELLSLCGKTNIYLL